MSTLKDVEVKAKVEAYEKDKTPVRSFKREDSEAFRLSILSDMPSAVKQLDALRAGSKDRRAVDISFADFVKDKWGFSAGASG